MDFRFIVFVGFIIVSTIILHLQAKIQLRKKSTFYLTRYDGESIYGVGLARQIAYDSNHKVVFVVGEHNIQVIDIKNVEAPERVALVDLKDQRPVDVEICGNYLFVAVDNPDNPEFGKLRIYWILGNRKFTGLTIIVEQMVGPSPGMVLPLSNCRTVLVTLEGKPYLKNGVIEDPEGGVVIVTFDSPVLHRSGYLFKRLDFKLFNNRWEDLEKKGARFVYRENNNTFARDIEPEYITLSEDEKTAYVSLQENNAIAEIDIQNKNITDIHPLGYKNWTQTSSGLDVSDRDGGIFLKRWPVYGMYQPDAIRTMKIAGFEYLVSANEGNSKDYSKLLPGGFNEATRIKYLKLADGSPVLKWAEDNNIVDITNDTYLGRLTVSKVTGKSATSNSYDNFYAFGARSFSIWRKDENGAITRAFDSGSHVELSHRVFDRLFNAHVSMTKTISETTDRRSDNKGPECETLEIAQLYNKTLIFVGNERPGSVSIYSITNNMNTSLNVNIESIWSGIDLRFGHDSWSDLYKDRLLSEINPEDIRFVHAKDAPNKKNMLLVAGASSGTLSLFEVIDNSKGAAEMLRHENGKFTIGNGNNFIDFTVS